ncbi:hypothetical protein AF335_04545 [Streptomyces eurocidicus]|uniref:Uncharacterized protein n=1 Tax=Streptomyces eurocidicus TaxID=66423 RepID=A0A2N8P3F7_STREU|nr:hypothetical protein [Streptomyces eurocidicus]MBB5117794.1 hypothetical protein [Streptomyces eurocidicus]MBF6055621.1 hypothetical protein [Streptomyces eurocidicus]PNE35580.1 hypothetical protein AF335_04545 [Streptomyces eurocidicus]
MPRLRLRVLTWPRRLLVLTDTPRPDCPACGGEGGTEYDYGAPETGEYAGTDWDPCPCWDENRYWVLLPLPRLRREGGNPWNANGYSDEPPY